MIVSERTWFRVLRSVKLHHDPGAVAGEISYVSSDRRLAAKMEPLPLHHAQRAPHPAFAVHGRASKLAGALN
jgi:hypothetical protein